jgi:hypothetical protein
MERDWMFRGLLSHLAFEQAAFRYTIIEKRHFR